MVLTYSLIRFSCLEQKKGDSFRRQTALRDAYLARHPSLTLDTRFMAPVEGVSAFRGKHRKTGALKFFLDAIEKKRIKKGSYLIIESLDRLSREQVQEAFKLFMEIIGAGVTLITLVPEMEYTAAKLGLAEMILALAEFTRAHGESLIKSERSGQHWLKERAKGMEGRLAYNLPAWIIRTEGGKYKLDAPRAKVIRQIFWWSIQGIGGQIIARRLNEQGIACFGRGKRQGKRWHKSYIALILRSRTAIGELQPHVIDHETGERVPFGAPLPNYFPAVVTPTVFAKAQQAVKSRNVIRGGINRHCTNLFARKVRDTHGNAWTLQNRNTQPYLVNTALLEGTLERQSSIPYRPFQRCVLEWIKELQLDPNADDPLDGLKARKDDLEDRLATMKAKMKQTKQLASLLDVYAELEKELEEVDEQIEEATTPRELILADAKLAIDYLAKDEDDEDNRRELRLHLSLLLTEIEVYRIEGKFRSPKKVYYLILRFQDGQERQVWFETPEYQSGPWSETGQFDKDTMDIRSELIRRGREAKRGPRQRHRAEQR